MTTSPSSLSVVIPVYNEEANVAALAKKLHDALSTMGRAYEILLVDDGSRDASWDRLKEAAARYPHFRLIRFRRNFGQTAAMSAGIDAAKNEVVVTLDADLQNDPADIPRLLEEMEKNDCAVVSGWRKDRKDPFLNRRLPSMLANGLISNITGVKLHDYGCTLKAYRRDVLQGIRLYGEMHRFIPALCSWVGGDIAEVVVSHHPRVAGQSKYGIGRTFRVILDLFTVKFLLRFTGGPMQLFGKIAFFFGGAAALMLAVVAFDRLFGGGTSEYLIKRPFWVITPFMLLAFCMQFLSMGLLAEVQIRTYHESQDKRIYAIRETFDSPWDLMPGPGTPPLLLPIAAALALLLTAGVAAGLHLSTRRREFSTPWKILLAQFAAANPWRAADLGMILLALAGAQLIRSRLPASTLWDVLAFQGAVIAGILWRMRGKPRPFGGPAPSRAVVSRAVVRWLAILPVLWFLSFTWQILLNALGHAPDFQDAIHLFLDADNPWTRVQFIVFAVILAPIAEEALFRGILLPLLVRRLGPGIGLALVAIGFAALHGDIGSSLALAVFSLALSLAYARTGTILVPMAMHALFNAANLALLMALIRAGVVS